MRMEQGNKGLLPEQGYRQPQVLLSTLFIHYQELAHSGSVRCCLLFLCFFC